MTKQIARISLFILAVMVLLVMMPGRAQAARDPQSVVVNGPGVSAANPTWGVVNVTFNVNTGGSGNDDWQSTSYRYDNTGDWFCVDHANYTGDPGSHSITTNIVAPVKVANPPATNSGVLYWRAHSDDDCDSGTTDAASSERATVYVQENNPPIAAACGINAVLILDESYSIYLSSLTTNVRNGAIALWDALEDTGSTLAIVEFNTASRKPFGNVFTSVVPANKAAFLDYINATPGGVPESYDPAAYSNPNYYTNWEDAFVDTHSINLAAGAADIVFFFTDGEPTTHNPGSSNIDTGSVAPHLPPAAAAANVVKVTDGSHVMGIGVGSGAISNIAYVTGPELYAPGPPSNFSTADYTASTGASFGNDLKALVLELCQASVTVTKETYNGTTWVPASGWQFTATVDPSDQDFTWEQPSPPAPSTAASIAGTTAGDGTLLFQWEPATPTTTTDITIAETMQNGYVFVSAACEDQNNAPVAGQPTSSAPPTVNFDVANNEFYTCLFRNSEVLLEIEKTAPSTTYGPGEQFTYTIEYGNVTTNDGYASTARNIVVTDQLHADLKYHQRDTWGQLQRLWRLWRFRAACHLHRIT